MRRHSPSGSRRPGSPSPARQLTIPPHPSADAGLRAALLPGPKPCCVHQPGALSSPALAGQQGLQHQVPLPELRLWPATVPGAAPRGNRDAAPAAPRERPGRRRRWGRGGAGRAGTTGFSFRCARPRPRSRALQGRGGCAGTLGLTSLPRGIRASVLGAEKLPSGDGNARGREDDLPVHTDALHPPATYLPGHRPTAGPAAPADRLPPTLGHSRFLPGALLPRPAAPPSSQYCARKSRGPLRSGVAGLRSRAGAEPAISPGCRGWRCARPHRAFSSGDAGRRPGSRSRLPACPPTGPPALLLGSLSRLVCSLCSTPPQPRRGRFRSRVLPVAVSDVTLLVGNALAQS